ncbi:adenylosuccinate lyase [Leptospira kanakyensis]|uniref:adenylosuccinate lyase n=1 Tax=Leptospira kanakyensis TaxID=2484968 RepID=UPI00223D5E59|nr:adenylosuccinate lyase [Leptospira kanakyensis]MCW7469191.1 adenylosuccinate lyase [Leptospira kanakyensis]MCW7480180.1 adenylosuccinate lyase [Leptospira kanakyensis]
MIDRYSHPEISAIWELENKFKIWTDIEIYACEARANRGEVPKEDLETIKQKAKFNVEEILEIESKVHHDVIAYLTNLNSYIGPAGRHVHFGLTSSDVGDTALCVQMVQAMDLLIQRTETLLQTTKEKAKEYKDLPCIGRSHGIHAEPMTLGLKFALFFAEMTRNLERMKDARAQVAVGKLSGAVGTYSNIDLEIEEYVLTKLGLTVDPIATQVISRDRHAFYMSVLGVVAASLDRMATEIRLLQKTEGREVEEPFAKGQKGSSAMPHKRNPVVCERISGISRVIRSNVNVGLQNVGLWHERDISHSSAERIVLPDSTIALDYILEKMNFVLNGLHVYPDATERTLNVTRGLIFSQKVLLWLIEKGGITREDAYLIVQENAMAVWADQSKNLRDLLKQDPRCSAILKESDLDEIFQIKPYLERIPLIFKRLGIID